jgi:hypothetical protein
MEEKIRKRIAELEKAEQDARLRVTVIVNLIEELRQLIEAPILSGDPLGEVIDSGGEPTATDVNGVGVSGGH